MLTALPARIINYKVSPASPTDELLTVGQILAEVGDCAASYLDPRHLAVAKRCATRLKKIVGELINRGAIATPDDLYTIPADTPTPIGAANSDIAHSAPSAPSPAHIDLDLAAMTIAQLHTLYRQWPLRHRTPHTDFHLERAIIRELSTRRPSTQADRLKIDYCTLTLPTAP